MHTGPLLHQGIVVVGATGCGKSTLAERLARHLGLDFIELDGLFWKPGWVESSKAEFRARVDAATRAPGWVLAGNYGMCRDIVWPRAEAVIWLDYRNPITKSPLPSVCLRAKRAVRPALVYSKRHAHRPSAPPAHRRGRCHRLR